MNYDECRFCQSYSIIKQNNNYYCSSCNSHYYNGLKKNINTIKNFSNKEAHFKNIIKTLSQITTSLSIDDELINDMREYIDDKGLNYESIDTQFVTAFSKKKKYNTKKNYILYHYILCCIKDMDPIFTKEAINIITIIFYDFTKFLCKYNKINLTISYQLLINNILSIFNINNNLNPTMKNNLKDKKWDIWNKYIINVCQRYLEEYNKKNNILYYSNIKDKLIDTNDLNLKSL